MVMDKFKLFCGIDISKAGLDVVYGSASESRYVKVSNDAKGIHQLLEILLKLQAERTAILICCENTGSMMDKLACVLKGEGIFLWAVHPLLLSFYAIELNRFKTDKADARKLFTYAMTNKGKAICHHHPSDRARQLRELFNCRKNLIKTRSAYECRIQDQQQKATCDALVMQIEKQLIGVLNDLIKAIQKAIKAMISADKEIKRIYNILVSVPCIGPVTAWHLLFITDCFEKFDTAKSLAAYIGCAPYPKQSGTTLKRRDKVSSLAYRSLKTDLNQGIVSVCTRPGQLFYHYYQAMIRHGKHHLYVLNAIKNILLKLVFKLVRTNEMFNAEIFMKNKLSWQKHLVIS
jgi:transposase